jgi:predicted amidohydrolase
MDVINVTADAEVFTSNAYLALGDEPTLVTADVDPGRVTEVREEFPALADRRTPASDHDV